MAASRCSDGIIRPLPPPRPNPVFLSLSSLLGLSALASRVQRRCWQSWVHIVLNGPHFLGLELMYCVMGKCWATWLFLDQSVSWSSQIAQVVMGVWREAHRVSLIHTTWNKFQKGKRLSEAEDCGELLTGRVGQEASFERTVGDAIGKTR